MKRNWKLPFLLKIKQVFQNSEGGGFETSQRLYGVFFLFIYSLGFAVPMLIAGYAAQFFRNRFRKIGKFPVIINIASGLILVAFGAVIFFKGTVSFGF
jgi:cytochrome c-type biogenesis protein